MPRGGARVGAGRPKGSLGKPAAARGDKLKAGPRAYGEGVSKDEELKKTEKLALCLGMLDLERIFSNNS